MTRSKYFGEKTQCIYRSILTEFCIFTSFTTNLCNFCYFWVVLKYTPFEWQVTQILKRFTIFAKVSPYYVEVNFFMPRALICLYWERLLFQFINTDWSNRHSLVRLWHITFDRSWRSWISFAGCGQISMKKLLNSFAIRFS